MVAGQLVVELKAVPQILPVHVAQVISYLKAARKPLGRLLNFHGRYYKPVPSASSSVTSTRTPGPRGETLQAKPLEAGKSLSDLELVRIVGAGASAAHQAAHHDHERPKRPRRQSGPRQGRPRGSGLGALGVLAVPHLSRFGGRRPAPPPWRAWSLGGSTLGCSVPTPPHLRGYLREKDPAPLPTVRGRGRSGAEVSPQNVVV